MIVDNVESGGAQSIRHIKSVQDMELLIAHDSKIPFGVHLIVLHASGVSLLQTRTLNYGKQSDDHTGSLVSEQPVE